MVTVVLFGCYQIDRNRSKCADVSQGYRIDVQVYVYSIRISIYCIPAMLREGISAHALISTLGR